MPTIEHEPGRFFTRVDGLVAEVVYERRGRVIDVLHTFTPPELRGRELAARLTEAVCRYARDNDLRIVPSCSYTRGFLAAHPEFLSTRDESRVGEDRESSAPRDVAGVVPRQAKPARQTFRGRGNR